VKSQKFSDLNFLRLTKFAKISGKYVLFDVAVLDLQYTFLVWQIEVLSARSSCTIVGKYNV
jgi:hypothetical protein